MKDSRLRTWMLSTGLQNERNAEFRCHDVFVTDNSPSCSFMRLKRPFTLDFSSLPGPGPIPSVLVLSVSLCSSYISFFKCSSDRALHTRVISPR